MKRLKLVTIGGGSSYTPELINGLIQRHQAGTLDVKELWLVDIEDGKEKLEIVSGLARRMIAHAGMDLKIHTTLDRREALVGADFVTTQFRVGLLDARIEDERRAYRFGLIGQETNGVGGFSKALRTIPVILDICKDMEELCPQAWMINFANPSGMVTEAVLKYSNIKAMGVCNRAYTFKVIAGMLANVDYHTVDMDLVGLNHFFFINGITADGKDCFGTVFDQYKVNASEAAAKLQKTELPIPLLDAIHSIPNAYLDYYFMKDKTFQKFIQSADKEGTRGEVVKEMEKSLFEKYRKSELHEMPEELKERGGAYYSDVALDTIDGIVNDRKNIQYVNVQNQGVLPYLPDDAVIECSCIIDRNGAHPCVKQKTNELQQAMISLQKSFERLTIEAAREGDYQKGLMALTINPLVFDAWKAVAVYDDLLEGNRTYLPQFSEYFMNRKKEG